MVGERGPHGDHGQQGDIGLTGPQGRTGLTGPQGKAGVPPWVVRQATSAYLLVVLGMILTAVFTIWASERDQERDRREQTEFNKSLCIVANDTRAEINKNREAARKAYSVIQPAPGSTPEQAARTNQFREDVLATIDGNIPLLDCSGIGSEHIDFSIHGAVRNGMTSTPSTQPRR